MEYQTKSSSSSSESSNIISYRRDLIRDVIAVLIGASLSSNVRRGTGFLLIDNCVGDDAADVGVEISCSKCFNFGEDFVLLLDEDGEDEDDKHGQNFIF